MMTKKEYDDTLSKLWDEYNKQIIKMNKIENKIDQIISKIQNIQKEYYG